MSDNPATLTHNLEQSLKPKRFAHLHQHTQYSLLDGAARVKDLLKWVAKTSPENPALAMTDHGNMHGAVQFFKYAKDAGVKPIIGYEAYVSAGSRFDRIQRKDVDGGYYHLTLLAKDFKGYQNLCKLASIAYLEGFYQKPRIDREVLALHREGIIAMSGCLGAEVPNMILNDRLEDAEERLKWYLATFGDDYYIEIQNHGLPEQQKVNPVLKAWAAKYGVGMVATNDGHYVRHEDAYAHEVLLAIQTKALMSEEKRFKFSCEEFYVKTQAEMENLLPSSQWGDEIYDNSMEIAEKCNLELPIGSKRVYQMPALPIPEGRSMAEELRVQVYRGTVQRYPKEFTLELLREYAALSLEKLDPENREKVLSRTVGAGLASPLPETKLASPLPETKLASPLPETNHASPLPETMPDAPMLEADAGQGDHKRPSPSGAFLGSREGRPYENRVEHFNLEETILLLAFTGEIWLEASKEQKYTQYVALDTLEADESTVSRLGQSLVVLRRAEYELGVIIRMGFPDYFLIVADFINWAKDHGIRVGPGRGSGAGSLVAFALKITNLDPIGYGLLFERFLNPDRVSMPDFDVDFSDSRRNEVINYVRDKYGDDKVAMIATYGTMSSRACFKDVARVLELPFAEADKLSKLVPVVFGRALSLEAAEEAVPDIKAMLEANPETRKVYEIAKNLEGLTRHSSIHASGVVIGRERLDNIVPLMRAGSDEGVVCQFDMSSVEDIGLIKMDFLGLRTLSFLEEAVRIIKESKGVSLEPDDFPLDDVKTYELVSRGETKGVFQLEGGGITDAARKLKPRRIEDINALSALYRPGPMDNIPAYIERHHGREAVRYDQGEFNLPKCEPLLRPILEETYGIPVYQEQIMQIASAIAGYTLGQADLLRRAMGKKKLDEMEKERVKFVAGAKTVHSIPEDESARLFGILEKFANYGFNKSHSASYALLSFQTAYIKAHYPVEFMAALLTVERRNSDKVAEYIADARQTKLENGQLMQVTPPDINRSSTDFKVVGEQILFGLYGVKSLGEETALLILEERERAGAFKSLANFCSRMQSTGLNKRWVEFLVKCGAFDAFGAREALLESVEEAIEFANGQAEMNAQGMDSLFGMATIAPEPKLKVIAPPASEEESRSRAIARLQFEKEAVGLYISGHPLEHYPGMLEAASTKVSQAESWFHSSNAPVGYRGRKRAVLAGMISGVQRKPTKSGGMMARFILTDDAGAAELVAFSRAYDKINEKLIEDSPALVVVEIEPDGEEGVRVTVEELLPYSEAKDMPKTLALEMNLNALEPSMLSHLDEMLQMQEGIANIPIHLRLLGDDAFEIWELTHKASDATLQRLKLECPWLKVGMGISGEAVLAKTMPAKKSWEGKPKIPRVEN
jgi:DNA polymerase III subunit alpha